MAWCSGSGQQQPQVNNTQQVWHAVYYSVETLHFSGYTAIWMTWVNDKMQAICMVDNQEEMHDGWPRGYWSILRQAAKHLRTC